MEALRQNEWPRMTLDEFERWEGGEPDGKYELVDGIVVIKRDSMSPESLRHNRYKASAFDALRGGLRASGLPCEAFIDGPMVKTGMASARQPDAIVQCSEWDDDSIYLDEPIITVEIISPSGRLRDTSQKLGEYFELPSVLHYLIVDPNAERLIWHRRTDEGAIITQIAKNGTITLDVSGFTIDVDAMLSPRDSKR